jgi:hypothetical protein
MTYNGWSNYETWVMKLWIDNEQWSYSEVTSYIEDHKEEELGTDDLAEWLKGFADQAYLEPLKITGPADDLLQSAWSEIDWYEIAEAYLEE